MAPERSDRRARHEARPAPNDERLVRGLFPDAVIAATAGPGMEEAPLFPEEEACIRGAVPERRREFVVGRACARAALARFGVRGWPIGRDRHRAPVWPPGFVGSLSHCKGFCGAVVGRRDPIVGLGLDVELARPLPPELAPRICTPREIDRARSTRCDIDPYKLIFSAKESTYKACYTLVNRVLEFHEVEVAVDPDSQRFTVEPGSESVSHVLAGTLIDGRFAFRGEHVLTGATVTHSP